MKNITAHVGYIALSEQKDGHLSPAVQMGITWHKLDSLQLTMLQEVLLEFKSDFDALEAKIAARTAELGYGNAMLNDDVSEEDITALRDMAGANKGKGQGGSSR